MIPTHPRARAPLTQSDKISLAANVSRCPTASDSLTAGGGQADGGTKRTVREPLEAGEGSNHDHARAQAGPESTESDSLDGRGVAGLSDDSLLGRAGVDQLHLVAD